MLCRSVCGRPAGCTRRCRELFDQRTRAVLRIHTSDPIAGGGHASHRDRNRLEITDPGAISEESREIVEQYNRDDVVSTWRLREWLEVLRTRKIADGVDVP